MDEGIYRIRIKQGGYEFDVSGDKEFVEGKYQELKLKPAIAPASEKVRFPEKGFMKAPSAEVVETGGLHEKLGIEKIQLDKILKLGKDSVLLIKHSSGVSRIQKQCDAILVIAYALKEGLNSQKLNSQNITLLMKHSGVEIEGIENAFTSLGDKRFLIREKKGSKLKILTPQGESQVKDVIQRLSKE